MSRSWFSNFQGAADWATGNRWDFDNLGKGSVADSNPPSAYDNNDNDGGYKTSWSDAFRAADKWNQGQKGDYNYPGYMSQGPMNWPTSGVTKVGNNSTLVSTTAPWWNDYKVIQSQPKQGGGIGGAIGTGLGYFVGNTIAPGIGGKIGGSIGGSIGSSF